MAKGKGGEDPFSFHLVHVDFKMDQNGLKVLRVDGLVPGRQVHGDVHLDANMKTRQTRASLLRVVRCSFST